MSSKFEIIQGVLVSPELYKARELWKTSTINDSLNSEANSWYEAFLKSCAPYEHLANAEPEPDLEDEH